MSLATTAADLGLRLLDVLIEELGAEVVRARLDARLDAIDAEGETRLEAKFPDPPVKPSP